MPLRGENKGRTRHLIHFLRVKFIHTSGEGGRRNGREQREGTREAQSTVDQIRRQSVHLEGKAEIWWNKM